MTLKPTIKFTGPLYAITLILSAFLLFSVQPMFTRMILPLLGGSPSVWNTAMVFFQAMLLAGYAYAHGTSRFLSIRSQAVLHLTMLLGFAALLPIALPTGLTPPASSNPGFWQLGIMAMLVGAPFFIIAASAPMLQRWFSGTDHPDAANPYFLYAASNIGSMAALLSYPVLVEPLLTLKLQTLAWAGSYGVLIAMTAFCALLVWKRNQPPTRHSHEGQRATRKTKTIWMILAFIPSSLLLGVTTYITTDLASVPLLWILPLALYLATFILVFARKPIVSTKAALALFTAMVTVLIFTTCAGLFDKKILLFILHLALFFSACLLCHKKLADLRPHASELTAFYMYMSVGGVLGGMFNALLAPLLFIIPLEYVLVLCATLFIRAYVQSATLPLLELPHIKHLLKSPSLWLVAATLTVLPLAWNSDGKSLFLVSAILAACALIFLRHKPLPFALFGTFLLLIYSPLTTYAQKNIQLVERNFFGILRIVDSTAGTRNFMHGTTLHGAQPKSPALRLTPITYYHRQGPFGDVFKILDGRTGPQKIGVLGLGAGTIACYTHPGRSFDFYEIDPAVVEIAENEKLFTYLSDCGSPYKTIIGDGRLTLQNAPDASYDVLVLDAFSSDNIPMHLLTLEAFRTYMRKVKAGGIIIFNISNRFIDLEPQLAALSQSTMVPSVIKFSSSGPVAENSKLKYNAAHYVVFSPDPETLLTLRTRYGWEPTERKDGFRVWTDDYANIIAALILHKR
ncbi:MAG: spermidine synthase [Micavibrio sp.]